MEKNWKRVVSMGGRSSDRDESSRKLDEVIVKNGFKAGNGKAKVLLLVVDDRLHASIDRTDIKMIEKHLNAELELSNLREVHHVLGIEVGRHGGVFKISLGNYYINRLLKSHGMEEGNPAKLPKYLGYFKQAVFGKPFDDPTIYRSVVGALLYMAVVTRSDIAASAAISRRRFSAPSDAEWMAAKGVMRFLKKTRNYYLQ
ncbi:uncharacterized protein LOC134284110 [Aedes albopictus]|uniref:Reverse transcriptase Ty1/copia-type domain-containing protein n=1 Tax=Aedes albopictus TaxID=7160 RepID=A0ABM1Y8Y5_AEDAL